MAITFPLNLPSQLKFAQVDVEPMNRSGLNESPFTGEEQIYVHQGEWWEFTLYAPPMERADAEDVVAWLTSLNGLEGSFLLPAPGYHQGARGSLAGAPTVMGSSQTGKTLASDGWTVSAANVLKAGDWFQLGSSSTSRIYKLMQAASADVYGQANLEIWPRLRESPTDNDALVVSNPKGLFRLKRPGRWSIGAAMIYGIPPFAVREAI